MKQLNLFENTNTAQMDLEVIEKLGYKVQKAFNVNFGNKLDDTYKVIKDNMIIAHIQTNENGTYNVIGGLQMQRNRNISQAIERIEFIFRYREVNNNGRAYSE